MDGNKLQALQEVKWNIAQSCRTCLLFEETGRSGWGLCGHPENLYQHGKHQREHQLPAHIYAGCDLWEVEPQVKQQIEGFLNSPVTS